MGLSKRIIYVFFILFGFNSVSFADELSMKFTILVKADKTLDYVSHWNDELLTANIRTNLVVDRIDDQIKNKIVSISKAQPITIEVLDDPEFFKTCAEFKSFNFEYVPGVPDFLTLMTLMGTGCKSAGDMLPTKHVRIHFLGIITENSTTTTTKSEANIALDFYAPQAPPSFR